MQHATSCSFSYSGIRTVEGRGGKDEEVESPCTWSCCWGGEEWGVVGGIDSWYSVTREEERKMITDGGIRDGCRMMQRAACSMLVWIVWPLSSDHHQSLLTNSPGADG